MIRVLLVDDQPVVRRGLAMILAASPDIDVVGEAGDGRAAVTATVALSPDVVLMDIRMPVLDGIAATREILALPSAPRVVILTSYDPDQYVFDSLTAGASAFLLKSDAPERFPAAIRAAYVGESLFSPDITRRLIERYVTVPPQSLTPPDLTTRETDVLELVARGLSNAEIATTLFIGEGTVKGHVAHLLTKFGVRDRVQLVVTAYETGLIRPTGRRN